jgi:hypothetical protein
MSPEKMIFYSQESVYQVGIDNLILRQLLKINQQNHTSSTRVRRSRTFQRLAPSAPLQQKVLSHDIVIHTGRVIGSDAFTVVVIVAANNPTLQTKPIIIFFIFFIFLSPN